MPQKSQPRSSGLRNALTQDDHRVRFQEVVTTELDQPTSLTSLSTASPVTEEVPTPPEDSKDMMLSPFYVASQTQNFASSEHYGSWTTDVATPFGSKPPASFLNQSSSLQFCSNMADDNHNTSLPPEQTAGFAKLWLLLEKDTPDSAAIEVDGPKWHIADYSGEEMPPAYTCVSYVWGDGNERVQNPYKHTGPAIISTHALPALTTAVANFDQAGHAFWLDAFCIPVTGASEESRRSKQAAVESMGHIYSCAKQVCVVLPEKSYLAMAQMNAYMENSKKKPATVLLNSRKSLHNLGALTFWGVTDGSEVPGPIRESWRATMYSFSVRTPAEIQCRF